MCRMVFTVVADKDGYGADMESEHAATGDCSVNRLKTAVMDLNILLF